MTTRKTVIETLRLLTKVVRIQRKGDDSFAADEDVRLVLAQAEAVLAELPEPPATSNGNSHG